ncbi:DNA polymerase beta superfamily protein [Rickettsia endosymbiont of Orchestes rusci]|uniref:DNA polymerase beta superfamily protein n=1 Tax=Rickettsia endosymbiont of Orchestes rusci TaxID=3066250 RepID=UPI00313C9377
MKIIVQIKCGSHLYGTSTPASDLDIKGLYIPEAQDILLQRVQPIISFKRPKMHGERNTPDDVDYELYSIERFLSLLTNGQPMALDMLFAPTSSMLLEALPEWQEIQNLAPKLFVKQADSFLNYCKRQANKYGIKGSRIAAIKTACDYLNKAAARYGDNTKLAAIEEELKTLVFNNEYLNLGITEAKEKYFEICGKKALLNSSVKFALTIAERLMNEYGMRAISAEHNEGIDWKALSHAVRVGHQAIEFLTTGHITFPRPEAKHLLNIKLGKLSFRQISEEIEELLKEVELAALNSRLPNNFDQSIIDDFIERIYRKQILKDSGIYTPHKHHDQRL